MRNCNHIGQIGSTPKGWWQIFYRWTSIIVCGCGRLTKIQILGDNYLIAGQGAWKCRILQSGKRARQGPLKPEKAPGASEALQPLSVSSVLLLLYHSEAFPIIDTYNVMHHTDQGWHNLWRSRDQIARNWERERKCKERGNEEWEKMRKSQNQFTTFVTIVAEILIFLAFWGNIWDQNRSNPYNYEWVKLWCESRSMFYSIHVATFILYNPTYKWM